MTVKEDLNKIDKKIDEVSIAYEMLKDNIKDKRRWFIIWIITFLCLISSIVYIIYLHDDINTITDDDSIEIQDVESIDNSHIKIGDDVWEKLY